jgi:hypothetical protein
MVAFSPPAELLDVLENPKARTNILRWSTRILATARGAVIHSRDETADTLETALKLGYYRARMNRFLEEKGLVPEQWLRDQRGKDTRPQSRVDRRYDLEIAINRYPELHDYTPTLSYEEIVRAAHTEFTKMLRGVGSHVQEGLHRFQVQYTGASQEPGNDFSIETVVGKERFSGEETVSYPRLWVEGESGLPPIAIEIARHLVPKYGLVPTLYWIWSKIVCEEPAELLRSLGGSAYDELQF